MLIIVIIRSSSGAAATTALCVAAAVAGVKYAYYRCHVNFGNEELVSAVH